MPSITSLRRKLTADYTELTFTDGENFSWNPKDKSVSCPAINSPLNRAYLMHEVAHGILGHDNYTRDIELIGMEREAWEYATTKLAPLYGVSIDETIIEDSLDTYRDWLHQRSLCPSCQLNGIQESRTIYRCLHCRQRWSVNEARTCRLKRTAIKNSPS